MALDKRTRQKLEAEAALHARKGRLKRAADLLTEILAQDGDDDRLFVKLAELRVKLGDLNGVRTAFRGAATAAERKGFYLRAMAALRQLARHEEPADRPWSELAELAMRLGLVADALGFLDEGIKAWEAAGQRDRALAALRRSHQLAGDDVHRALRLALELRAAGRRDDALAFLVAEAERHRSSGRVEAWLPLAREKVLLDPADTALAIEVVRALLAAGDARPALPLLQAVLRRDAGQIEPLRLLVRVFSALVQPEKALAAARELARALVRADRALEAVLPWRELLAALPDDLEARAALGLPGPAGTAAPAPRAVPVAAPVAARAAAQGAAPMPAPAQAPPAAALPTPPPRLDPALASVPSLPLTMDDELVSLDDPSVIVEEEIISLLGDDVDVASEVEALAHADLSDDLAHAAFLITHRFVGEARELLESLGAAHPGHPGVAELTARLQAGREIIPARAPSPAAGPATPPAPTIPVDAADETGPIELASAEEVLARFRAGVAQSVAPEDAATHYDLGIAYREMGLVGEARAEFEAALLNAEGTRAVDCLVGVALCQAAQGDQARATRTLKKALASPALTPASAAAVFYELGGIREAMGDPAGAAWAFAAAERSRAGFRDATARAARAEAAAGGPTPTPGLAVGLPWASGA